jgi:hypothetical protein
VLAPPIEIAPARITLPRGPQAPPVRVTVRSNLGTPLSLWEPQTTLPGARVTLHEMQPGELFQLSLAFPPGFDYPTNQFGKLTVKTSDPQHPELEIPILPPAPRPAGDRLTAPGTSPPASARAAARRAPYPLVQPLPAPAPDPPATPGPEARP